MLADSLEPCLVPSPIILLQPPSSWLLLESAKILSTRGVTQAVTSAYNILPQVVHLHDMLLLILEVSAHVTSSEKPSLTTH